MEKQIFVNAVKSAIKTMKPVDSVGYEALCDCGLEQARRCDNLFEEIVALAKNVEREAANFVEQFSAGSFHSCSPAEYSSVRDLGRKVVEFKVARDGLRSFIVAAFGKDGQHAYRDAIFKHFDLGAEASLGAA